MSLTNNKDYFWCAFQAHQDSSIIIQYIVLFAQSLIFILLIYARIKAKRQQQLDQISVVYKLIIVWLICFFLKTLINVIAYTAYIQQSPSNIQGHQNNSEQEDINFSGLRVMSSLFLLLDGLTTFFLQIAMIYIPYLWMKNALQLLSQQNLIVEDRIQLNRISRFLGLIRKYLLFRNIYVVYFLAVMISVIASDAFQDYNKYISVVSLIQSVIILVVYPLGLWTWSLIKKNISLNQRQAKSMLIQYIILISCNAIRIVLNSVFYFSNLVHYKPDKYCYDNHQPKQTMINCLYLGFGLILMHIVPGAMILYVYWPSKKDKMDLKNSLLISSDQNKFI